ncbi:MFS transporter [Candidatus Bipolaricaulota sp. J31]
MERKRGAVWIAAVLHGLNDGYGGFLPALMPLIIERMGLSLALAGALSSARMVAASFAQPLAGHLADRLGYKAFLLLGPAVTCTVMSLIFRFPGYLALGAALFAAGLGTAAFHPAGAALAGSGGGPRGYAMSVFIAGGTVGAALGPLFIGWFADEVGISRVEWLLLPALGALAAGALLIPNVGRTGRGERLLSLPRAQLWTLALLWGIAVLRALVGISYRSFLAVLLVKRGAPLAMGGAALALFALAGALGGIVSGRLSDRFGRKRVIWVSLAATIPALYAFLYAGGTWTLVLLAVSGFLLMASNPVSIAYAQELFPEHQGTVSGVLLGLSWGLGALMAPLIGHLGDLWGLERALGVMTAALIPATLAALFLPAEDLTG